MWIRDCTRGLEDFEESLVREGYIVASGISACYEPLLSNTLIQRSVFGSVFHLFKINPEKPLFVRFNENNGGLHIYPFGEEYGSRFPAEIHSDAEVWNAALFMLVPGNDNSLTYSNGLNKHIFDNSFLSKENKYYPVSLISILESRYVDFDGNYSNQTYSFVPAAQVGAHLFDWIRRPREVISHEHSFEQRREGSIEISTCLARKVLHDSIVPNLEEKFKERINFPKRSG